MAERYYNPFQTSDLRIPESYREEVSRYCQGPTQEGSQNLAWRSAVSPHSRYVVLSPVPWR